jgi:hypothetical protein
VDDPAQHAAAEIVHAERLAERRGLHAAPAGQGSQKLRACCYSRQTVYPTDTAGPRQPIAVAQPDLGMACLTPYTLGTLLLLR